MEKTAKLKKDQYMLIKKLTYIAFFAFLWIFNPGYLIGSDGWNTSFAEAGYTDGMRETVQSTI